MPVSCHDRGGEVSRVPGVRGWWVPHSERVACPGGAGDAFAQHPSPTAPPPRASGMGEAMGLKRLVAFHSTPRTTLPPAARVGGHQESNGQGVQHDGGGCAPQLECNCSAPRSTRAVSMQLLHSLLKYSTVMEWKPAPRMVPKDAVPTLFKLLSYVAGSCMRIGGTKRQAAGTRRPRACVRGVAAQP